MANGISGHVNRVNRKRGDQWYAKYRLADGRQVQRKLGPAWPERAGRPPAGHFTRKLAEAELQAILTDARRGTLKGANAPGVAFAELSALWLKEAARERACKHSTLVDYELMVRVLDKAFGETRVDDLSARQIEDWLSEFLETRSNRTGQKYLTALSGILAIAERRWRVPNATAQVRRPRVRTSSRIDVFTPEEVWAVARAADTEQDAALFLTAAFTGLRLGELLALRWRCVNFTQQAVRVEAGFTLGKEGSTKSSHERVVPMAPEVGAALARLGQRDRFTDDGDLVFVGVTGGHLSPSKLRKRYTTALDAACLRRLRFHDLRHTFGSTVINRASPVQVKAWMGHASLKTTERYLHFKVQGTEADLLAGAFEVSAPAPADSPTLERDGALPPGSPQAH